MQGALTRCLHTAHAEELQSILQKPLNPSKQVSKGSLYVMITYINMLPT